MDSHSEADAPRLYQIQKVNACLHSLIQKVSLLFLISRLRGGGFRSHADLASYPRERLLHSPGPGGNVKARELVAAMGKLSPG